MLLNMQLINLSKQIVKYLNNKFLFKKKIIFLVSFDTPSTFAVSIYSLFYLLYILYPNNLRRELQPETIQSINSNDKPTSRLGIERVLLVNYSKNKIYITL